MKHSLTALLLTLALFCCLLTGCGPTPDVPGGSEGSNGSSSGSTNSGTEPDDSNSGGVSAPKLQPSIVMESFSAYHDAAGEDVARCVFRATNPNTAYSVSRARVDLTLKDAAGNVQETTYFMLQTIAPGDTVRFAYTYKCKKGVPASAAHTQPSTTASSFQPSAENVRSSDLHAVVTGHSTTSGLNYTVISGTVRNLSKYTCNRTRVSVILKRTAKSFLLTLSCLRLPFHPERKALSSFPTPAISGSTPLRPKSLPSPGNICFPGQPRKRLVFLYPFAGRSGSGSYSFQRGRFRSRSLSLKFPCRTNFSQIF